MRLRAAEAGGGFWRCWRVAGGLAPLIDAGRWETWAEGLARWTGDGSGERRDGRGEGVESTSVLSTTRSQQGLSRVT